MGQVCKKHEEFYETECRWCEPEPSPQPQIVSLLNAAPSPFAQAAQAMINAATARITSQQQAYQQQAGQGLTNIYGHPVCGVRCPFAMGACGLLVGHTGAHTIVGANGYSSSWITVTP